MDVFVNGKLLAVPTGARITDALDILKIGSVKGVAVAVNNNVIGRADWEHLELNNNDRITLIKATQGG